MSYSVHFKVPLDSWIALSKVVPGKFCGSVGHSERNCLQDRSNIHKSRAGQIVLIFNAVYALLPVYMDQQNMIIYPTTKF